MNKKQNCPIVFSVGDIVEATQKIWRVDHASVLRPGDRATISDVWRTNPESPQIIGLEIEGQMPMGNIVCFDDVPLKLISSNSGR